MAALFSRLRRAVAVVVTAALIALLPGPEAYAAAGRAVGGTAAPISAPAVSAPPVTLPVLGSFLATPGPLNQATLGFPGASLPGASAGAAGAVGASARSAAGLPISAASAAGPAPAASSSVLLPAAAASAPAAEGALKETTLQRLSAELPDFSRQGDGGKQGAEADFLRRAGQAPGASNPDLTLAGASAGASPLPKAAAAARLAASEPARPARGTLMAGMPRGLGRAVFAASGVAFMNLSMGRIKETLLIVPMLLVSMIFHEMGHARTAYKLGDPGPVLENRASFRPRDLLTHVDPAWTVIIPALSFLLSGALIGMARPVDVDRFRFKKPTWGMTLTALSGPAVNLGLAVAGALAFAALGALGFPAIASAAALFTTLNVSLAFFNLIPFFPLDGHHVAYSLLPSKWASEVRSFYERSGWMAWLPLAAFMLTAGGFGLLATAVGWTSALLLGVAQGGAHLAVGFLPALAAVGMMLGAKSARGPALTAGPTQAVNGEKPVEYVVMLKPGAQPLSSDFHLSFVDLKARSGVRQYASMRQQMLGQLEAAGVPSQALADRGADPIATYQRINAVTLRADAAKAPQLKAWLESLGHSVYDNSRREIVRPVPLDPESADPLARNPVSLSENLNITRADAVHKIAAKNWGKPDLGLLRRAWAWATGQAIPQPAGALIDTGAALAHPLLKRLKGMKNATSGPNEDDNGHGSWVSGQWLNYSPWAKNITHYKTFVDGGATLDDILKALTMAGNDGNLVISNSWGSDDGDPESPDSKLVLKLAQEGHIMVFAAGNAGPRANTIGSPAIVQYKDAATGVIRVLAVAAADRDKNTANFSSRGPASPATKGKAGVPHRPDLTAVGYNTDGPWPDNLGPDRVDPTLGPLKAISGTSMSTPAVAGAIHLLCMMFGVTAKGAALDAVVNAVMSTLDKSKGQPADAQGEGFLDVEAAYNKLVGTLGTPATGGIPVAAMQRYLQLGLTEQAHLDYLRAATGPFSVPRYANGAVQESVVARLSRVRDEKSEIEKLYPNVAYWSQGRLGRVWARLRGRGPR